jgi:hypothetical protein
MRSRRSAVVCAAHSGLPQAVSYKATGVRLKRQSVDTAVAENTFVYAQVIGYLNWKIAGKATPIIDHSWRNEDDTE